uniref:Uncharacterized protein n=1 Tax=Parascaris univalens TaxID=6257 RepID=A0A915CHK3_PARUN
MVSSVRHFGLLSASFFIVLCSAILPRLKVDPVALREHKMARPRVGDETIHGWSTGYCNVPIDNFAFTSDQKYLMKYLYNLTYYELGGPIFFYAGNEGSIEGFAENTGIMFDLAEKFKAAVFFAEHRYYGASMPFGNLSNANASYLGYLSSTQALADFAKLITLIKTDVLKCPPDTPVIAFGGSYGGMLAAWLRMKYPHIVSGAWSSSSPLLYFEGGNISPGAFEKVVKEVFISAGCNENAIINGLEAVKNLSNTAEGRQFLNDLFRIDSMSTLTDSTDSKFLVEWIQASMDYMAMVNYPYPTNFLQPLPGWPVKYSCENFAQSEITDARQAVTALYQISNVYYNFTGTVATNCVNSNVCGDVAIASLGAEAAWSWQTCTELLLMMCSEGPPNDFFENQCEAYNGPVEIQLAFCAAEFTRAGWNREFLDVNAIATEYGFDYSAASNIVFTNGNLDPWSSGGVYANTSGIQEITKNGIYTFLIDGSAHHLDLRQPNTCDPPSVKNARFQITNIIDCWVHKNSCSNLPNATPLPPAGSANPQSCKSDLFGYPWGQDDSSASSRTIFTSMFAIFLPIVLSLECF